MRLSFAFALALIPLSARAEQPPAAKSETLQSQNEDKPLGIGDPAPVLRITKWLQGPEVRGFASNEVYVVGFWATWCDACIAAMPTMSELQSEYRKHGLTIIAFTQKDQRGNSPDKVISFVEKRGPKLGISFAYADNGQTYAEWMTAAKQKVLPCTFVVAKDGSIAFIGHPMFLVEVLPKVLSGKWTQDDAMAIERAASDAASVTDALRGSDAEKGLQALGEFQKAHPKLASSTFFTGQRIGLLLKAKKFPDARKAAEEAIARASATDDIHALSNLSFTLRSPAANKQSDLLALALKAAEAGLKAAGEKDAFALYNLAEAYYALGDRPKAREYGSKAVAASVSESDAIRKYFKDEIKKYDEEKHEM